MRKEAFDLQLLAQSLGVEPPEGWEPPYEPEPPVYEPGERAAVLAAAARVAAALGLRVKALALAALVVLVAAPAALAEAGTGAEVNALAARAAGGDATALAQLRRIDSVDGRPVDLGSALDANGVELRARLDALAAGGAASQAGAVDARRDAADILGERRFHESRVPRPLHGVLAWLGDKLRFLAGPFDRLAARLPGGWATLWFAIVVVVLVLAVSVARRLVARRGGRLLDAAATRRTGRAPNPDRLERDAADAEQRGDLDLALRLRFRAGLIRLARAEVIPGHEPLTSGQLRRLVSSPAFDRLSLDLDEVVYGDVPASRRPARPGAGVVAARARGGPLVTRLSRPLRIGLGILRRDRRVQRRARGRRGADRRLRPAGPRPPRTPRARDGRRRVRRAARALRAPRRAPAAPRRRAPRSTRATTLVVLDPGFVTREDARALGRFVRRRRAPRRLGRRRRLARRDRRAAARRGARHDLRSPGRWRPSRRRRACGT